MRHKLLAACAAVLCLATVGRADLDPKNFDPGVQPKDDFDQFANGGWKKANPVPDAYSRWGAFNEVDEHNKTGLHAILERVSKAEKRAPIEQQVGDFYASGMDEAAIAAAGLKPLQSEFDLIAKIQTAADVQAEIARLHTLGVNAGFAISSEQDAKNSAMVIVGAGQGGLSLPDRDYYLLDDDKSKKLREQYVAHVAKMLELAGDTPAAAAAGAQSVVKIETALAQGSKKRVELRDPVANYHKLALGEVQALTPHFDWNAYFARVGLVSPADLDIGQPDFFKTLDTQLAGTSVADWQVYLRWHLIHSTAAYLSPAFVDENFAFFGKTLTGAKVLRERWKRVLDTVDGLTGEALGQLYVKEYFPPESKARMLKLVGNLRVALHDRIENLEWMDAPTKAKALAKLDAFTVKIGYPDKWIDYSTLSIDRGPFVLNVLRARVFEHRRDLAKVGKPVDRTEWGMSPPTVNAYHNPLMNEIVFPAGILQPPFFDAKADDATNYGGIGAVIGHEMTHGFDDEGRQFDAQGNLTDWWTAESAARFKERSAAIIKQFDSYVAVDDLHINGQLTTGENIADLGGLKISYAAMQKALIGQKRQEIAGFTEEQRFFLSWATVWHQTARPEESRRLVRVDPHSPAHFRVIGPLSNLPEFYEAFNVPVGAQMRRSPEERVVIW